MIVTDEWNPIFYSPIMTLATAGMFKSFGVGMIQLKLLYLLLSVLGLYLLYRTWALIEAFRLGILLLLLLGTNFIYVMYTRLGLCDNFMTLLLLLSSYLGPVANRRPKWWFCAGGDVFYHLYRQKHGHLFCSSDVAGHYLGLAQ